MNTKCRQIQTSPPLKTKQTSINDLNHIVWQEITYTSTTELCKALGGRLIQVCLLLD